MTPLIKGVLVVTAATTLVAGYLFWQNGGLRQKIGATEQACATAMENLAAKHEKTLRERERELRAEEAARVAELRGELRVERDRRIEVLRRNRVLETEFQGALDALNSPEEAEWKAQKVPDSLLWLDAPSS